MIIDEASQSDVNGLLAWFLGDRIAVVGDNEQVSPLAVGQNLDVLQALIDQHLDGVPNKLLYGSTTSVYDFAVACFGGTIRLREHFRCVPDIVEFSNELCYDLEIRPLRDPSAVPRPYVVEHVVHPSLGTARMGKTNDAEAHSVVALLKAAMEMDEYADKTMGPITLLGDEQADLIQDLAVAPYLKGGDLRRTLIEYVRAPGARRRAAERAERRAESPFEAAVIRRLATAGYHVESQVWVGGYRIDMVVSDGTHHAALECDGDRFHPIDRIPADMARQAVLERVGWRFVRIRGTRFYRHADATMAWVFEELDRLGVEPVGVAPEATASADAGTAEFRDRVVRRAWEIMHEGGWVPAATEETAGGPCHD